MSNIITATFGGDCGHATTASLWQYDYGQVLQISGLDLPGIYQVHFCNKGDATTITMLGNADGVSIPDNLLETGLPVFAYIYLHTGADDGETEYKITIPVNARPAPSDEEPTPAQQSALDAAVAALQTATEAAEDAAQAILDMDADATTLEAGSSATVTKTVDAEGVVTLTFGIPQGEKGATGDDGVSPTVTITEITGGHRITIADASGSQSFDVMDGDAGITIDAALSNTSEYPVQNKVITAALALKQALLTFDPSPTNGSQNPVTSGGVYTALSGKADSSAIPTKTSQLQNDSGFLTSAPVISVNGQTGAVVITIPTKVSDLNNDSGFVDAAGAAAAAPVQSVNGQTGDVTVSVPSASSATPAALGTAAAGSSAAYARGDHVHAMPSKSDVGLGNVDNTSDANKPISTATQTALDGKITAPASPTSGQFLVYDGSAWVAMTLATWQGGSF